MNRIKQNVVEVKDIISTPFLCRCHDYAVESGARRVLCQRKATGHRRTLRFRGFVARGPPGARQSSSTVPGRQLPKLSQGSSRKPASKGSHRSLCHVGSLTGKVGTRTKRAPARRGEQPAKPLRKRHECGWAGPSRGCFISYIPRTKNPAPATPVSTQVLRRCSS